MDDLKRLVLSAQTRDSAAFGELVERFQDMAFALAYAQVAYQQQAEDIAQEAFIEAYLHIDRLASPHAFTSWFRTIVQRQISRALRGKRPSFCSLDHAANLSSEQAVPERQAEANEMHEVVHNAIHTLPENERQAIILFYIGGYSQKEMAEMLDVRLSTVKSRLYEARQKLRERMSHMVEEYLQDQRPSNDPQFAKTVMEFIEAIEIGDTNKATKLIEKNERLLKTPAQLSYGTEGWPPLFLAIEKGNVALIALLLDKGVDVNDRSETGWTPHHWALNWRHHDDIAAFMVERGAKPDIFSITQMGELDQLKAMLQSEPKLIHTKGPDGATLLHFAQTIEIAEFLLGQGADVNALDNEGKPALWYQTSIAIRPLLLERGAIVDDIIIACEVGALEHVKALLAKDPQLFYVNGSYPLLRAALNGHTDVVRYLLTIDDNVNYTGGSWGFSPITAAALGGNLETVQLLVEHGADINIRMGRAEETALHWAMDNQKRDIVDYLLENGAEVDAQTKQGATPLHWAVKGDNLECVRLLLEHGANPNITSELMEESPLMRAKRLQRSEVVTLLST